MTELYHKIVVIGGGAGGLDTAARLVNELGAGQVAVIEPALKHYYQPLWTLVGGGVFPKEDSERDEASVIPRGATWIQDAVTEFLPDENTVVTANGQRIRYDWLVVAAGIKICWDKIPGLPEALGNNGVCSNYAYDQAPYTWETLRNFKGGKALFTFPLPPIKCAGAPQKIMYLAEETFRKNGVRDKTEITYVCATPTIFSAPKYAERLMKIVEARGIKVLFKHNLVEIRPDSKEAVVENLETNEQIVLPYDMMHVAPPMAAPDFIKNSPLANAGGWVDVDKASLRHVRYANVFSLGDCSSLPTSKTAAAIRRQAPVLVENLLHAIKSEQPSATYNGYTSCPLITGYGKLILAEFDYDLKPQETFPFDQGKERRSMYLLKKYVLPIMYWRGLLRGRL